MKKAIIIALISVVVIGGLVAALVLRPVETTNQAARNTDESAMTDPPAGEPDAPVPAGRYVAYGEDTVSAKGYTDTILFFHASWCPECRAFESAIESAEVPEGVQILKVDYDSSADLRQRYGVTIQSTFVKVNEYGERQASWVGYGKDKSVESILENT